ncbi:MULTISPECIES: catechol 2,3-dioxygenase [Thermomonospora]|uniref:Metapyrocatechase n=1 Tax=Thermomonospora curvata (strain ATCC 19995 / DSM 43183 / JCM 3096 / KCTC 9072 / NBRC 15933 / NCIMB 10081 / Henssen B9) TaxID=471852 RepID=D1A3K1_THECD|nr:MULTISPECIES: catechol 2,3-dioxygenase [Thermomonospora]ACY96126.1 catechol 2,3 dioxygenase [Thermomonospora curvata DSM 43183]PKK15981.1 MAG: catechol 2,3-dioxygenase [Thermomonospora sp. CIF 1]
MGVMRLGYVHAKVTDLEEAKAHYGGTLGMRLVHEEDGRVYYKAWDEYDHHSVVLEAGGVGLTKLGYKVARSEDLEDFERRAQAFGCTTERMSKGDNLAVGDGVRIFLPSEHVLELYADIEVTGTETGTVNPDPFPAHLVGVGVPRIDHALLTCEDVGLLERFFTECLDFGVAERAVTELGENGKTIGTWMFCTNTPHDIAFIEGANGKLHHFAYYLNDWNDILHAGDLFSMNDVSVDIGPTRHGITRGTTIYFFDPAGNRNEVFSGGYITYPDFPTITWTADQLGKGIFYIDRELNDRFTTVVT